MKIAKSLVMLLFLLSLFCSGLPAQQIAPSSSAAVPRLVNFSGKATDAGGKALSGTVGITFAIYKDQSGGSPLWLETQSVPSDARGNYTAQLGATKAEGLPLSLFTSGEARWLGVSVNGGAEQPRVLLLSVPYALKAADAETIGGLPPSAFVLAAPANVSAANSSASFASDSNVPPPTVGGSGTLDFVPLWTPNGGTLGNSVLFQSGTGSSARVGINSTTPASTLDVNGSETIRGNLSLPSKGTATATSGRNSQPATFTASAFNSGTGTAAPQNFRWQAEAVGNDTSTASGSLNLLYGSGANPVGETGLHIASNGQIRFASGQIFPGTGTVTSIGLSAPGSDFTVSGSPVTSSGTLGLDWTVAPTSANTANAIVKRDGTGSFGAGNITAVSLTASNPAGLAIVGTTAAASGAVAGVNNGSSAVSDGVDGVTSSATGSGVAGINNGGGIGVYSVGGTGAYGITTSANGIGVMGQFENLSSTGLAFGGMIGVLGDGGGLGIGVAGTVDDGNAGYFENNSASGFPPVIVYAANSASADLLVTYNFGTNQGCNIESAGTISCTGSKSAVVPVDNGTRKVALYAIEGPENWFEDLGGGQLVNGAAIVHLEPVFGQTVNTDVDYRVFLTPNGDCKGLYVTNKAAASFEVRELGGGTSNTAFDYRIIAKRQGYENIRLADKTNMFDVTKLMRQRAKTASPRPRTISKPAGVGTPPLTTESTP